MKGATESLLVSGPSTGHDRISLSFHDLALEARYQDELGPNSLAQMRFGAMSSAVLWLAFGVLADRVLGLRPAVAYGVAGVLVLANLVILVLIRRYRRSHQHQVMVVVSTAMSTVAVGLLTSASGTLVQYGGLGVMLIALFAFVVLQLRFVFALVAAPIYLAVFAWFSVAYESSATVTQTFIVGSALVSATIGARAIEVSSRERFLQRIQISSLHQQVEGLLRRYLSPNVAEVVLADPATSELGGRIEEVSVLFADLQGFTPMSTRLSPEEVADLLNHYFELVVPTVLEEGGSVLSFGGDAVVAVFNAPSPCPDHALRASRAALRIQAAIADLRAVTGHAPQFRIGVNTGEVLVGNVGSAEMRTFTVIGDAVNLASRLQTHAEPGTVLIGPETFGALSGLVETHPINPVRLKGIADPIQPYLLVGLARYAGQPEPESVSPATPSYRAP